MATIGVLNPTIYDMIKVIDPKDQKVYKALVEILNETNEILDDITYMEGNLQTGHRVPIRAGLPTAYWRQYNKGVPKSKSRVRNVDEIIGMLEAYAEVDKDLVGLSGDPKMFRLLEDAAFLESMNQEMAATTIYGSVADTDQFVGLTPRYNSIGTDKTLSSYNVVSGGGSGADNTSIWFVTWSPMTTFAVYPRGSKGGFTRTDKGQETLQDSDGNNYEGYRTHYKWDMGLVVKDWRYNARVCNIDVSDLTPDVSSGADIMQLMITALYRMPSFPKMGRTVVYCNSTILEYLHQQAREKSNVNLTLDNVDGKPIVRFQGFPIKRVDAILNAEAVVS